MEDLRASAGGIVSAVEDRGERFVISRRGKPAAALVPIEVLEDFERRRTRLADAIRRIREDNQHGDPEAIDSVVAEAIAEY